MPNFVIDWFPADEDEYIVTWKNPRGYLFMQTIPADESWTEFVEDLPEGSDDIKVAPVQTKVVRTKVEEC